MKPNFLGLVSYLLGIFAVLAGIFGLIEHDAWTLALGAFCLILSEKGWQRFKNSEPK